MSEARDSQSGAGTPNSSRARCTGAGGPAGSDLVSPPRDPTVPGAHPEIRNPLAHTGIKEKQGRMCQGSRWDRLPPATCSGNTPLRPRGPDPRAASQPPMDAIHWSLETEFKMTHTHDSNEAQQRQRPPLGSAEASSGTNVPESHLRGSLHCL